MSAARVTCILGGSEPNVGLFLVFQLEIKLMDTVERDLLNLETITQPQERCLS